MPASTEINKLKTAVIGGGAAGFFAAIHSAMKGNETTLFEKSSKLLAKVKVSGGGRCNVTNGCTDISELVKFYPRGGRELVGPFTRFNTADTMQWFEEKGVLLKTEEDGRVFPQSDSSLTIINCLMDEAKKFNVAIHTNVIVSNISKEEQKIILKINEEEYLKFDKVIIATGGNAHFSSYDWLTASGHTIIAPVPSLFTFNIPENPFEDLMGVAINDVTIKIEGSKLFQNGPLLFTHWGLSGPAVLKLSSKAARLLHEMGYDFFVLVNFCNSLNEQEVRREIYDMQQEHAHRQVIKNNFHALPSRLWERLCFLSGINSTQRWNETGKNSINKLVNFLTATRLHVKGKTTFKEEFVTCGGVSLRDVNMTTMESKKFPGLYFAGEILDIDGVTGGFNFQAAWTTGYLAGINQ